jgi:eukaryotic-like serine/threonine-protein kinase
VTERPATAAPAPGTLLADRYRLTSRIAAGGMAQVWQATDTILEREVAVKILHPHLAADETFVARFRAEAVSAARLRHPNIVAIYDTCSGDGVEAIVMEMVRGQNLRMYLDQHGPLDPAEAVHIVAEVADALAASHRAGLVHRDIKPANVLIREDGQVMVTDFGIAKLRSESADLTQTGMMIGSVRYLSPEQVEGRDVDPRTDVYALGIVLYEALTGRVPFQADTDTATALARLHQQPARPRTLRPGIPRELEAVGLRALALNPSERYSSAVEFRAALLAAPTTDDPTMASASPTGIAPVPVAPAPRRAAPPPTFAQSERRWLIPTLLIIVIATALGLAGVLFGQTEAGRDLFQRAREAVSAGESTTSGADNAANDSGPTEALAIAELTDFDPLGDNIERRDLLGFALDGNGETSWNTEQYTNRDLNKPGVGLLLDLGAPQRLDRLVVRSPSVGWNAEVYVGDDPTAWRAGPSGPVDAVSDAGGDAAFDLGATEGRFVLLWITRLRAEVPHLVSVSDLVVQG